MLKAYQRTNNQLHARCLKLVNHKQTLQNRDKELAIVKARLLKLQIKNKHLVAKGVEVEKTIKKAKALQQEYNELNQVHFKNCNYFKALQTNYDWLMKIMARWKLLMFNGRKLMQS